jgi:uncharacterized protein
MTTTELVLVVVAAVIGGMMNSIAGGGTLLTFPALLALGVAPIDANATSTVALWPGALGSMWGYRDELRVARRWVAGLAAPSVMGGALGAYLLLVTPAARFAALVPWLVLTATLLFLVQQPLMRRLTLSRAGAEGVTHRAPEVMLLLAQFGIAIYGGYFGAVVGILMLAAFGFVGLRNIHLMNGLKNWCGLCMNVVAAVIFAVSGLVNWPVALAMAVGALGGGYVGSRTAQRVPQALVRSAVVVIGLVSTVLLSLTR